MPQNSHFDDHELLQAADGELSRREAVEIEKHLASCWACRARMREIEESIGEFVRAHHIQFDSTFSVEGPRALLKARIEEISKESPKIRLALLFAKPKWALGSVVGLAILGFALTFSLRPQPVSDTSDRNAAIPDPLLTPGLAEISDAKAICASYSDETPNVPEQIALQVFHGYGVSSPDRGYELDYLITPRLGGAVDARNLWPQPYDGGSWNAHTKDALEDKLYRLVCSGQIPLETAQQEIATDWIKAYQKYFNTREPLRAHAYFTIDRPWESKEE